MAELGCAAVQCINSTSLDQPLVELGCKAAEWIIKWKDLITTGEAFTHCDKLMDILEPGVETTELRTAWDSISSLDKDACQNAKQILDNNMCLNEKHVQTIAADIKKMKCAKANKMIMVATIQSVNLIVNQIQQLFEAWTIIKDARNVICEYETDMSIIASNVAKLREGIAEMEVLQVKWETAEQPTKIIHQIRMKISRLSTLHNSTLNKMSKILELLNRKQIFFN